LATSTLELPEAAGEAAAGQAGLDVLQDVVGRVVPRSLAACILLWPLHFDLELSRRLGPSVVYKLAAACGAVLGHGTQVLGAMRELLKVPLPPEERQRIATTLTAKVSLSAL